MAQDERAQEPDAADSEVPGPVPVVMSGGVRLPKIVASDRPAGE